MQKNEDTLIKRKPKRQTDTSQYVVTFICYVNNGYVTRVKVNFMWQIKRATFYKQFNLGSNKNKALQACLKIGKNIFYCS